MVLGLSGLFVMIYNGQDMNLTSDVLISSMSLWGAIHRFKPKVGIFRTDAPYLISSSDIQHSTQKVYRKVAGLEGGFSSSTLGLLGLALES